MVKRDNTCRAKMIDTDTKDFLRNNAKEPYV